MRGPRKKRARGELASKTARKRTELVAAYRLLVFLQPFKAKGRRCVSCDSRVTNRNLGGHDGRSAVTGPVWCLDCADYPQQLLLRFGV